MSNKKIVKFTFCLIFSVFLTLGFSISLQSLLAEWVSPTSIPPEGNVNKIIFNKSDEEGTIILDESVGISADFLVGDIFYVNKDNGNIGIGTTSPSTGLKLDIEGKIGAKEYCDENGENCVLASEIGSGGVSGSSLWAESGGDVYRDSGKVGIGTNTPGASLQVNNSVAFSADTTPFKGEGSKLLWIPSKSAFRAGYVDGNEWNDENIGKYSIAMGDNPTASKRGAIAMGYNSVASANYSTAIGNYSTASRFGSVAIGYYAEATGSNAFYSEEFSVALGAFARADADYSTAIGFYSTARGKGAKAFGTFTKANGDYSMAIGRETIASADYSTAMGNKITTEGESSFGIGLNDPVYNHVISQNNTMAIMGGKVGIGTTTPSIELAIEGKVGAKEYCDENGNNCIAVTSLSGGGSADNLGNHAATQNIKLNGKYLSGDGDDEGIFVDNSGKVDMGILEVDNSSVSVKNGNGINFYGNAFGSNQNVLNFYKNNNDLFGALIVTPSTNYVSLYSRNGADGNLSLYGHEEIFIKSGTGGEIFINASMDGKVSVSAGNTEIRGIDSNFGGSVDMIAGDSFTFKTIDSGGIQKDRMHIREDGNVGIGTNSPSTGLKLDIEGNIGAKKYCDENGNNCTAATSLGGGGSADNLGNHTATQNIKLNGRYLSNDGGSEGVSVNNSGNVGIGTNTPGASLQVDGSVAFSADTTPFEGEGTKLLWIPSKGAFRAGYAYGTEWNDENIGEYSIATGKKATASGFTSTAMGRSTTASGLYTTAMGYGTIASEFASTAMGGNTTASGKYSTAMGGNTTASGYSSIAMGDGTTASNNNTIASGFYTKAEGWASTAMGYQTRVSGFASTAMGRKISVDGDHSFGIGLNKPSYSYVISQDNTMAIMGGKVGIGTTSPGKELEVNGTVKAKYFDNTSDERLKKNIQVIPNALEKVLKVDGVSFEWKDDDERVNLGLTAQNVEKVFPELVSTDENTGLKSVQYGSMVAPLIEAIKEQQKQIKELKQEIEKLKN